MESFILLSDVANQATSTAMVTIPPAHQRGESALRTSNAPTLAFLNDTDTGIYNVSTNNIGDLLARRVGCRVASEQQRRSTERPHDNGLLKHDGPR
eukprot:gene26670-4248_t